MEKICPVCKKTLDSAIFHEVEADFCPQCLGIWFDEDELALAKDASDKSINWVDFDLWKEINSFVISRDEKICPSCRLPLYETEYGKSGMTVDLCNACKGIWLDRGEFKKLIQYLRSGKDFDALNDYIKSLRGEFWEIFTGPESIKSEVSDFLAVLKLLKYKFITQYPGISRVISELPK
jgi:uncharacterized protein